MWVSFYFYFLAIFFRFKKCYSKPYQNKNCEKMCAEAHATFLFWKEMKQFEIFAMQSSNKSPKIHMRKDCYFELWELHNILFCGLPQVLISILTVPVRYIT